MKTTIADLQKKYADKIDYLDLELIIAHVLQKSREFVLSHPEFEIPKLKIVNCELRIARRMRDEPLAYILGHKEFYGLDFKVTPDTLVPRPETEILVSLALQEFQETKNKKQETNVIDVGTGSGNIIISMAKAMENFKLPITNYQFIGIDISPSALTVAKQNAQTNGVAEKITFLQGSLLEPLIRDSKFNPPAGGENSRMIILANLPYLSDEIYNTMHPTVKEYEPKSALYSPKEGLAHYESLLKQIQVLLATGYELQITILLEISPEQKKSLTLLINKVLPRAQVAFKKDLAQKTRICIVKI